MYCRAEYRCLVDLYGGGEYALIYRDDGLHRDIHDTIFRNDARIQDNITAACFSCCALKFHTSHHE